ncbi:MAG: PQQ-binding-like beta-propeller repeat protein [Planctomycetaceae bacterium]
MKPVLASVICLTALASPAFGQLRPAIVEENRTIRARLLAVEEQLANGQNEDAIASLLQIVDSSGVDLVRASPRRLITVRAAANQVLAKLGRQALATYRNQVDPQANQWFERSKREPEFETQWLERIVAEAPNSTLGTKAITRLAQIAWRSDDLGLAYEYWRRLVTVDEAQASAKLVLCRLAMGELEEARLMFGRIPNELLDEQGELAGQTASWRKLLQQELSNKDWSHPGPVQFATTFRKRWSRRLSTPLVNASHRASAPTAFKGRPSLFRAARFGAGSVFISDCNAVHVFDLQSGLNPWTDEAETRIFETNETNELAVTGVPLAFPTLNDARLLARIGTPETSRGFRVARLNNVASNAIVCLDADERQGKLLWQTTAADVLNNSSFESDPVTFDARCFVLVRAGLPVNSLHLVCLSLEDGRTLWTKQLCAGLDEPEETGSLTTSIRPTVTSKHIIIATNNGLIVSVTHEGRINWVRSYDRLNAIRPQFAGDTAIAKHGIIYVAPHDADAVFAIREHTGELLWTRRLPDRAAHVLGTSNSVLVLSGRGPWGLNTATGQVLWGGPRSSAEHFGHGRGFLMNGTCLFPTRSQIEIRAARTGYALGAPIRIGGANITATDRHVAIISEDQITLWSTD